MLTTEVLRPLGVANFSNRNWETISISVQFLSNGINVPRVIKVFGVGGHKTRVKFQNFIAVTWRELLGTTTAHYIVVLDLF